MKSTTWYRRIWLFPYQYCIEISPQPDTPTLIQKRFTFFIEGKGEVYLDDQMQEVIGGDIVPVPRGVFHRVSKTGNDNLTFLCFFNKYPGRDG